jgi:hypothetical protein
VAAMVQRPSLDEMLSPPGSLQTRSGSSTTTYPRCSALPAQSRAESRAQQVQAFLHRLLPMALPPSASASARPSLRGSRRAEQRGRRRGQHGRGVVGWRGRGNAIGDEPVPHPRCHENGAFLDLRDSGVGDNGVSDLVDFLGGAGDRVTGLDLSSCRIGSAGCRAIARLLGSERCALRHLDLSNNPLCGLGFSGHDRQSTRAEECGVVALADAVIGNRCSVLTELRLEKCGIGAEGSRALRRLATQGKELWTLRLARNPLCTGTLPIASGTAAGWELPCCRGLPKTRAWLAFAMGQHPRSAERGCHVFILPRSLMRQIFIMMATCSVTALPSSDLLREQFCSVTQLKTSPLQSERESAGPGTKVEPEPELEPEVPRSWDDDDDDSAEREGELSETLVFRPDSLRVHEGPSPSGITCQQHGAVWPCRCSCEVALLAVRTPPLDRLPRRPYPADLSTNSAHSDNSTNHGDWGHWTGVLRRKVAANASPGAGTKTRQHPPLTLAPPAPRLGMFLTSNARSGSSGPGAAVSMDGRMTQELVFPNLALVHRALHPLTSSTTPAWVDTMETEARVATRGLLTFLGRMLGLEPAPERDCEHYTTVWALEVKPGAIPPSVCDVSAAVLAYQNEAWWGAEQAWQSKQRQLFLANEPGKTSWQEQWLQHTEKPTQLSSGDLPDSNTSTVEPGRTDALELSPAPLLGTPSTSDTSGHRFGESGTIDLVEDYSSFEEDGELWAWRRHRDWRTGRLFYVNGKTGEKQWHKPPRTVRSIRMETATYSAST